MTDYEISHEGLPDAIEACGQQETQDHQAHGQAEAGAGLAEWARGLSDAYLEGHNVASWNSHYTRAEREAMDTEIARREAGQGQAGAREAHEDRAQLETEISERAYSWYPDMTEAEHDQYVATQLCIATGEPKAGREAEAGS